MPTDLSNKQPSHDAIDVSAEIPAKFTDWYLKEQVSGLNKKIDGLKGDITILNIRRDAKNGSLQSLRDYERDFIPPPSKRGTRSPYTGTALKGLYDQARSFADKMFEGYNPWTEKVQECLKDLSSIDSEIDQKERLLSQLQRDLDDFEYRLKNTTPYQRADKHYQTLIREFEETKVSLDKEKLVELKEHFDEMAGYKDAESLGKQCFNLAMERHYNDLVHRKNEMDNFASSLTKPEAMKIHSDNYKMLAEEFNDAEGYRDTEALSSECMYQYHKLKERGEELEIKEKEEKAQRELREKELGDARQREKLKAGFVAICVAVFLAVINLCIIYITAREDNAFFLPLVMTIAYLGFFLAALFAPTKKSGGAVGGCGGCCGILLLLVLFGAWFTPTEFFAYQVLLPIFVIINCWLSVFLASRIFLEEGWIEKIRQGEL